VLELFSSKSSFNPPRSLILEVFSQFRFALSEGLHLGVPNRDIQSSPRRKLARLPACHIVCERNSVGQIRTQVGMRFEVLQHRADLCSSRKESGEDVGRDLREGELVTLSI
jgi:hypothetical protein